MLNGALAQIFGVFNLGMACTIGAGAISLSMLAVKDLAGMIPYAILLGLFSGACTALVTPMLGKLPTLSPTPF
jgi:NAD dependent epimerase/dehydratase family enzyme